MLTTQLQTSLAQTFPGEYTPDTWKELLPRFIINQIEQYEQQINEYRLHHSHLPAEQQTPVTGYPVLPEEFAQACEELARHQDLDFRSLACCLYLAEDRAKFYRQRSEQLEQQCGEFDQTGMQLRDDYINLHNGTRLGKWLN